MDDGDGGWLFVIGDWLLVNDITTTDGTAKNEERETRRPEIRDQKSEDRHQRRINRNDMSEDSDR